MSSEQQGREPGSEEDEDRVIGSGEQPLPAPTPDAGDGGAPTAQVGGGTGTRPECARCAPQTELPFPKIVTRDGALRRTVREWMEPRPDLRDPQYLDRLMLKAMLRRHYNNLSSQLTRNGLLTKGEGKLKQGVGTLLDIVAAIGRIDDRLPPPPPLPQYRYVARCRNCDCDSCKAGMWAGRGDGPAGEPIEADVVEVATKVAKVMGLDPEAVIRRVHEVAAEQRELVQLRSDIARLRAQETERAITGDVTQRRLPAPDPQRLLPVGGTE